MQTTDLDLTADIIDVRDIIARIEELEELQDAGEHLETPDCELTMLRTLLEELKGMGGDEQWRGDWYPVTLIRESYFRHYAQELAEDIGAVDHNASWPNNCIDWDHAAGDLKLDYSALTIDGETYWTR
jgi:hypothetical protein